MEDPDIAAAIVAGQSAGLGAAFDRYGAGLYAYCAVKLGEPAGAAGAASDTFAVAAARLRKLRDRGELRPWLYAVARGECVRRQRARTVTLDRLTAGGADHPAPGGPETPAADGQAGLRRLTGLALAELSPGNREVLELDLRHDLHGADLARVLGIAQQQAESMAARARSQFETALSRLVVLRAGRAVCPALDALLAGGDADPATLDQHIQGCAACGERAQLDQASAGLLALVPAAPLPPGLRAQALAAAGDASPAGRAHRDRVARLADPFGPDGFPARPASRGDSAGRRVRGLAAAAVLAAVAVAVAAVFLVTGSMGGGPPAASGALAGQATAPASAASGPHQAATPPGPHASARPSPSASIPASGKSARPAASASGSPAGGAPGTLAAPGTVTLTLQASGSYAGTFTLTARGGPVTSYSVSVTAPAVRQLAVSRPAGSLATGQSVTETVTAAANPHGSAPEYLTVAPGGQTITVVYG